jgi:hypothetical protein
MNLLQFPRALINYNQFWQSIIHTLSSSKTIFSNHCIHCDETSLSFFPERYLQKKLQEIQTLMSNLTSIAPFSQKKRLTLHLKTSSNWDKVERMEFRRNYDSRKPYSNKLCARQSDRNISIIWINNITQSTDNYCKLKKGFTTPDPKQRED